MNKKTALTVSSPRWALPKLPVGWGGGVGAGFPEAWAVGGGPANSGVGGNTNTDLGEGWLREDTVSP